VLKKSHEIKSKVYKGINYYYDSSKIYVNNIRATEDRVIAAVNA
jgi:hypothetical protein